MENFLKNCNFTNFSFYFLVFLLIVFVFTNSDIAIMLFAAIVLACSMNPLVDRLNKKMKRPLAVALVFLGVFLLLALIFVPLIVIGAYEIKSLASEFPTYISNIENFIQKYPFLNSLNPNLNWDEMFSSVSNFASQIIENTFEITKSFGSALIYILVCVIFIFYFLVDKDLIKETILKMFPSSFRQNATNIINIIGRRIGGYVAAQAAAILSVAIVMTLGLVIFRIDYAIVLGLLTGVLDIIPVIGPAIALVVCLVSTYEAGMGAILAVIFVFALAQLIENNFVRPYAFGKLLNLHPIVIFLFIFVATKYLGVIGTLFAPAIAAVVCVLVEEVYIKNLK